MAQTLKGLRKPSSFILFDSFPYCLENFDPTSWFSSNLI